MINLLIADDSDVVKKILKNELEKFDSGIKIIDFAKNGIEAYEKTISLNPDIVLMDIRMPYLNGIDATKKIINDQQTPVIIFSATSKNDEMVLEATKQPNVVFVEKPKGFSYTEVSKEIIEKVKMLFKTRDENVSIRRAIIKKDRLFKPNIICIGASTGGADAISELLSGLKEDVTPPILIIQHITEGFNVKFAEWLGNFTNKKIKVISKKEDIERDTIYIPDNNAHLLVTPDKKIYSSYAKLHPTFCPSVDVTFNSVSDSYNDKTLAILLTGMGRDGAEGMLKIHNSGGYTIAQDKESCVVFGMPKAALERNAVKKILPLKEIASFVTEICINGIKE